MLGLTDGWEAFVASESIGSQQRRQKFDFHVRLSRFLFPFSLISNIFSPCLVSTLSILPTIGVAEKQFSLASYLLEFC